MSSSSFEGENVLVESLIVTPGGKPSIFILSTTISGVQTSLMSSGRAKPTSPTASRVVIDNLGALLGAGSVSLLLSDATRSRE